MKTLVYTMKWSVLCVVSLCLVACGDSDSSVHPADDGMSAMMEPAPLAPNEQTPTAHLDNTMTLPTNPTAPEADPMMDTPSEPKRT